MQATGRYDRAAGGLAGVRRAGGVSRTGHPLSEPAVAATVHEQYVWSARYIDAPILRDRDSDADGETGDLGRTGSGLDERLYYVTDAHRNVTAVTTTAGAVVERYHYDPYGRVTILDGTTDSQTEWATDADQTSDVANEILYCGYRRDSETALYHVRHRTYHPRLGRWLQRDPIGYVDGMSLYEYCGSGPVVGTDPDGLWYEKKTLYQIENATKMMPDGTVLVGTAYSYWEAWGSWWESDSHAVNRGQFRNEVKFVPYAHQPSLEKKKPPKVVEESNITDEEGNWLPSWVPDQVALTGQLNIPIFPGMYATFGLSIVTEAGDNTGIYLIVPNDVTRGFDLGSATLNVDVGYGDGDWAGRFEGVEANYGAGISGGVNYFQSEDGSIVGGGISVGAGLFQIGGGAFDLEYYPIIGGQK